MASSSTSRSFLLLSLLLSACFCMTATASRSLQESNKLSLGDLDKIVHIQPGLLRLVVAVDLSEVVHPVEILLQNATGELVELEVVEKLVTELKEPIVVKVTVAGTVNLVVKALGTTVHVPVKLSKLDPVLLETLGDIDVVHVVFKLVEKVDKEVNGVLELVNAVSGKLVGFITGAL